MRETDREIRLVLKADSVKAMRYRLRYFIFDIRVKRSGGTVRTVQFVHTPNKRNRLFGVFLILKNLAKHMHAITFSKLF